MNGRQPATPRTALMMTSGFLADRCKVMPSLHKSNAHGAKAALSMSARIDTMRV
jgi:hypothetical protein